MSIQAVSWVLQHSQAKLGARLVLIAIANHADAAGGNSFPSVAQIAVEAHMSDRQVQRSIRTLERQGELLIRLGKGRHGTHLFVIPGVSGDNMSPDNMPGGVTNRAKNRPKMSPEPLREPSFKKEEGSEAKDASAPMARSEVDPVKEVFDRGVAILGQRGRSLLGQCRKKYGDPAVLEAIARCEAAAPSDPVGFLIGCLRHAAEEADRIKSPRPPDRIKERQLYLAWCRHRGIHPMGVAG